MLTIFFMNRKDTTPSKQDEVRYRNDPLPAQTIPPYSTPLPLTVQTESSTQKKCQVGRDGCFIPNSNKTEDRIPHVEFDDDIYLKSIQNNMACRREGNVEVMMQLNHSYFGTNVPNNHSTEV